MGYANSSFLDADEIYALLGKRIADAEKTISLLTSIQRYLGVTTTVLVSGVTTNPVVEINGVDTTAINGDAVIYNGQDFVYNGTIWQAVPQAFGALAYKNTASTSYTPAGIVDITKSSAMVAEVASVGSLPAFSYDSQTETVSFNAGSLPTTSYTDVVTNVNAGFSGAQATITVE